MKQGKLNENSLQRSVLRQIGTYREELQKGALPGGDCASFSWNRNGLLVTTQTVTLPVEQAGRLAVYAADNNIAADGGATVGISVAVTLPEDSEETSLKRLMKQIDDTCRELRIQISGGHTQISREVASPVITVTAFGYPRQLRRMDQKEYDVVLSKYIGIEGTAILSSVCRQELLSRYAASFLDGVTEFWEQLSVRKEAVIAGNSGVCMMHDLHSTGVFGGLWELARKADVGLQIDLKKMPILQETVELCECMGLNPYQMISGGSLLMLAQDGGQLVHDLEKEGIPAFLIGTSNGGHDKVLQNEDEVRFLEKPGMDEIYKIF